MATINTDKGKAKPVTVAPVPGTKPADAAPAPAAAAPATAQTIPATAPAAPAAPAAKAKKNKGPDLSRLTPEARQKFDQLMADLKKSKEDQKKLLAQAQEVAGIPAKKKTGTVSLNGLNGDIMVTADTANTGYKADEDKAIAAKIGVGIKLKDLLAMDNVDYGWFRYRLVRGGVKLGGMNLVEIINKALGVAPSAPAAEGQAPVVGTDTRPVEAPTASA